MLQTIITRWKKKSLFSKITDFIFIALIITLLFPQGRMAVGGFINRVKSMVVQPDLMDTRFTTSDAAFEWQMTGKEDQTFTLAQDKGKVVFLNLWATWCPPCVGEMPGIQKLYNKYKDNPDVSFVLVSNETPDVIAKFVEKKGYTFPVYSSLSATPAAFATRSIPTTFVLDKKGSIAIKEIGAMDWGGKKMERMIEELLNEQ